MEQIGDPLADMLYTSNLAHVGLREAVSATGEKLYRDAEDRLAAFSVRIQVRSAKHPELDGAWFRAFDVRRWKYWASNADAGWGAWSIETDWIQSWSTSVLAMRQINTSDWDVTRRSEIRNRLERLLPVMSPPE
ncbi:MAG: hypothetical protein ABFD86_10420 [Bryobacteraceae bacterium]